MDCQKTLPLRKISRVGRDEKPYENIDLFPTNALNSIRNRAAWITDHEKHSSQLLKKREHTAIYENTPERKLRKKETEAKRNKTPQRKEYRKEYEKEFVASGKREETEAKRYRTSNRKKIREGICFIW